MCEDRYQNLSLSKRVPRSMASSVLQLPVSGGEISSALSEFGWGVRKAYANEYEKPSVVELGNRPLMWYERIAFTDL